MLKSKKKKMILFLLFSFLLCVCVGCSKKEIVTETEPITTPISEEEENTYDGIPLSELTPQQIIDMPIEEWELCLKKYYPTIVEDLNTTWEEMNYPATKDVYIIQVYGVEAWADTLPKKKEAPLELEPGTYAYYEYSDPEVLKNYSADEAREYLTGFMQTYYPDQKDAENNPIQWDNYMKELSDEEVLEIIQQHAQSLEELDLRP